MDTDSKDMETTIFGQGDDLEPDKGYETIMQEGDTESSANARGPEKPGYEHPFTDDDTDPSLAAGVDKSAAAETEGNTGSYGTPGRKSRKRKRKKGVNRAVIVILAVLIIAVAGMFFYMTRVRAASVSSAAAEVTTATARRMTITSELSGSSSLSPKDTYDITSLVEGEILECTFEQGDVVEEGDILYVIDSSSMNSSLSSAQTNLVRAQENLATANENYSEAAALVSGNIFKSTATGYIQTLYIREGDKVSNGTRIADIYDDSIMRLTLPFLTPDADLIPVGVVASITLEDTGEKIQGIVTSVSDYETTLSGGRLVKNVTIEVENPGGLTESTMATARVGEVRCASEGSFTAKTEFTLSAELNGNSSLEVEQLLVTEGSHVTNGSGIFTATSKSVNDYLKTFQDSVNTASDNVENAENQLENTEDSISDYTITAPISGTIVTKNSKAGDKISKSSNSSTVMAVIYDLSSMTLSISVDELDVFDVEVGQTVQVTADALEGEVFYGTVTNVSLQGSYSNGVTNYPVTVTLEETGELRPGMNVDAVIVLEASENAICIPVGALQRGDRVFVKDSDDGTADAYQAGEGMPDAAGGYTGSGDTVDIEAVMAMRESELAPGSEDMPEGGFQAGEMPERESPSDGDRNFSERTSGTGQRQTGNSETDEAAILENINNTDQTGVPEGFHAVTVVTGIISDDYVEILSGINEGDVVYVDPNAASTTTTFFNIGGGMGGFGNMGGGAMGGGFGGGRP